MSDFDLSGIDFSNAILKNFNLQNTDLSFSNLSNTDLREANLKGANISATSLHYANINDADLAGANLDYSCLPLWCGSLHANFDDRQIIQILYHCLSAVKFSKNVSDGLKEKLLTPDILEICNRFHRVKQCGKL